MDYNLTTHFKSSELACKCGCEKIAMENEFLELLERFRKAINRPVFISSGFRCENHNKAVGGSHNSYHLRGKAVDIVCKSSIDRYAILREALKIKFTGIGIHSQFIHVDNRDAEFKKIWVY